MSYPNTKTPLENRDTWQTPRDLFQALNAEFHFQLDAAASDRNALCKRFITAEENTLEADWSSYVTSGYAWLNPPYSDPSPFIEKTAREKELNHVGCVMLLPADTSVGWFKSAIGSASEVRFITGGRLSFVSSLTGKPVNGNNKGSMLIIWHPWPTNHCQFSTVDRNQLLAYGKRLMERAA
nr:phage N-6-adenine-methyltransferase [Rosenbergiella metrosideri]